MNNINYNNSFDMQLYGHLSSLFKLLTYLLNN